MSFMMQAVPNPGASYKAVSHAHPLPTPPSAQVLKEQRLRALISQQPITVHLHGLPFERAPTVADVLMPKVRRSVFNENVNPNNLDVISCWKGLTHAQSAELAMWYCFLHRSLHDEALTRLRENLIEDLLQSEEVLDEVYLVPCILNCFRSKPHRLIDISFVNLIDSMLSKFCERCSGDMAAASSTGWGSHLSGGLSRFLDNFLRAQDCFVGGQYLEVDFDFQYSQSALKATGEVNWQCIDIRFLPLPERLSAGEEYRIAPFMPRESLGTQQVKYSIVRSSLNFHWDPEKRCFTAIVPDYADEEQHVAETVLAATVTTPFPGDVRFERESRWSIQLDISPAEKSHEPSVSAMETELQELLHKASWNVDRYSNAGSTYTEPPQLPSPPSPQKRGGLDSESVSRDPGPKRRCYARADQAGGEPLVYCHGGISIPTSRAGDGYMTGGLTSEQLGLERDYARIHASVAGTAGAAGAAAPRQPAHSHASLHSRATPAAKTPSPRLSSLVEENENAVVLQQQQILSNYHEFKGRRALRDAGLASPVSDTERVVFEGIFLRDGDGDGDGDGDEGWELATTEEEAGAGEFDSGMGDA